MLWDTAGQEEFDALTKAYYRGAQVITQITKSLDFAVGIDYWLRLRRGPLKI